VNQIKHVQASVSHTFQHSTFCSTNITVISEHPSEARNREDNVLLPPPVSTVEFGIKLNYSNTDSTSTTFQNKYLDNDRGTGNCETGTKTKESSSSREAETDAHIFSHISPQRTNSNGTTVIGIAKNPVHSHNASQISSVDSSVELDTLSGHMSYSTDAVWYQDKSSPKKSVSVTFPEYSPVISSELNVVKHLKDSTDPIQWHAAPSTITTNSENSRGDTVIGIQEQRLSSENTSAQNVSCDEANVKEVTNPEYTRSAALKGPIHDKDENSLVGNFVQSTNLTCNINPLHTDTQHFPLRLIFKTENIKHQKPYTFHTTSDQAVTDSNASKIRSHNTEMNMYLHKTNIHDPVDSESNHKQEVIHPIQNETKNLVSMSNTIPHSQSTTDPYIHKNQDCQITLTRPCRENSETPHNYVTTNYCRTEESSVTVPCSVPSVLSMQMDTAKSMNVLELVCSPSTSVSNPAATRDQSIGYQIMESSDASPPLSLVISKSTCSSTSIASTPSENTLNSFIPLHPSTDRSPVHSDYTND
jgi:hypothetical protein